jgi:hypothetical protein
MTAAFFVMAIMGCGEGDVSCQQVRLLETRYESQAACAAATEVAVARFTDIDYPVVVAQCLAGGSSASLKASEVKLPEAEATPLFPRR